ncbi:MAG: glycine cleavage T C-terminal barrel domain-containing protein [Myxococcota bacterium]
MTSEAEQVAATRAGAGARLRPEVLTIEVTGHDRVRFLNGMISCDVERIAPDEARRAVKANAKGRVEGILRVRVGAEAISLDVLEVSAERVATELMRFVVMDDVQLADGTAAREVLTLLGPRAPIILAELGWPVPGRHQEVASGDRGHVIRDDAWGLPGFEIHARGDGSGVTLMEQLAGAGVVGLSAEAFEVLRVEAGQPKDGVDVDLDTLPLEARLDDAIDHDKGCYLGQEVIARATHRGGVKHHLVGLVLDDPVALPSTGAELWPEGAERSRGEVTSAVLSSTLGRGIALGYLHVDYEAPGTRVEVKQGGRSLSAEVVTLPFVPA